MATASTQAPRYLPVIHKKAQEELTQAPPTTRESLKTSIREAATYEQPTRHPKVRPLRNADNIFRVREGKFRALCDLELPNLRVLLVAHREDVYDKTETAIDRR